VNGGSVHGDGQGRRPNRGPSAAAGNRAALVAAAREVFAAARRGTAQRAWALLRRALAPSA
jgi:hypothetical protein